MFDRLRTAWKFLTSLVFRMSDDPETVLRGLIADMRAGYRKAEEQVQVALVREQALRSAIEEARRLANTSRAECHTMHSTGELDPKRETDQREKAACDDLTAMQSELKAYSASVEQLKRSLKEMAEKIDQAERQMKFLLGRRKMRSGTTPSDPV